MKKRTAEQLELLISDAVKELRAGMKRRSTELIAQRLEGSCSYESFAEHTARMKIKCKAETIINGVRFKCKSHNKHRGSHWGDGKIGDANIDVRWAG